MTSPADDKKAPAEIDPTDLLEKLAAIEHARWSQWHLHAVKNWTIQNNARWDRQAHQAYEELSETEKDSDRREVKRYWHLIEEALASERHWYYIRARRIKHESIPQ